MYTDTWEVYKGTESNLTDGDNTTALDFNTKPGDTSRVGDFIGWDFGKTIQIGKFMLLLVEIVMRVTSGLNIVYNTLLMVKIGQHINHMKVLLTAKMLLMRIYVE